jgi:cyclic pyranopterin phosphate synthase
VEAELTHLDASGTARMVDVGGKTATERYARARAVVRMSADAAGRVALRVVSARDAAGTVTIVVEARTTDRTGVEMEAMVACSVGALCVYDMVKGIEPGVVIERVELLDKTGGKADFHRS